MHVEDHPLAYGEFEGVIPEGYGAGIVMLWDRGTWKPEVDDVEAALKKGDLKFTLNGYKLKGSWVLVRTKGWPGAKTGPGSSSKSWLLIKHRDEWSGDLDITTFAPKSVKSQGDFEDILAEDWPMSSSVRHSSRPAGKRNDKEPNDERNPSSISSGSVRHDGGNDGRAVGAAPGRPAGGEPDRP
jgi:bifunctional non-homologous end joining protein LigD